MTTVHNAPGVSLAGVTRDPKRTDIQALRAVAVAAVVVYHFWPGAAPGGFVGVDIFFVISGFLITGHLLGEIKRSGAISLRSFYARRIKRILPSAYLVASISALLALVLLPVTRLHNVSREGLATIVYVQNILLARDSVDYLAEGTPESPFRHYWSLSVEEQFYIVLPLVLVLCLVLARRRVGSLRVLIGASLLVIFVASFVHSVVTVGKGDPAAYFLLSTRMWELLAGSILAFVGAKARSVAAPAKFVALGGWLVIVLAIFFTPTASFPGAWALPAVAGTTAIMWANYGGGAQKPEYRSIAHRMIENRAVQYVGDISYNLYLTHWPTLIFLPSLIALSNPFFGPVALAISLVAAAALYRFVDRPLARIKVTRATATRVIVLGVAASAVTAVVIAIPGWVQAHKNAAQQVAAQSLIDSEFDRLGAHELPSFAPFAVSPKIVVPLPSEAKSILPSGAEGRCKSTMSADYTPTCLFGPATATTKIALVGDSHIEQYLPAFEQIANTEGVAIETYFHSSCPLSTAQRVSDADRGGPCKAANEKTLQTLLADESIDLIVTSNRTAVPWVSAPGVPDPAQGFADTWDRLARGGKKVLVLQDNPLMLPAEATTECVAQNPGHPELCDRAKADAMPLDYQLDAMALTDSATLIATEDWFCTEQTCPAVIGNVLVYRDEQHISLLYAQTLAGELWREVSPNLD